MGEIWRGLCIARGGGGGSGGGGGGGERGDGSDIVNNSNSLADPMTS